MLKVTGVMMFVTVTGLAVNCAREELGNPATIPGS